MKRPTKSTASTQGGKKNKNSSLPEGVSVEVAENALRADLKLLTHRILADQELDRRDLSQQLNDDIAQMLLGIGVQLTIIQQEAKVDENKLIDDIASTKQLAARSVMSVLRVADRKPKE